MYCLRLCENEEDQGWPYSCKATSLVLVGEGTDSWHVQLVSFTTSEYDCKINYWKGGIGDIFVPVILSLILFCQRLEANTLATTTERVVWRLDDPNTGNSKAPRSRTDELEQNFAGNWPLTDWISTRHWTNSCRLLSPLVCTSIGLNVTVIVFLSRHRWLCRWSSHW